MPKPVIIYVTPRPPYPQSGGVGIRQFQLLRAYAECAQVHLLSFCSDDTDRAAAGLLETYCESVHLIPTRSTIGAAASETARARRIASRIFGYRPNAVDWYYSAELRKALDALAINAHLVHVARLLMVPHVEHLLRRAARPRIVFDLDDVESVSTLRTLRYGPREPFLHHLFGYYDLARVWMYERSAVKRVDRVFVCSERDRRRFATPNVAVVPNGTCVPASLPAHHSDGRTLIFCGTLSYAPNADAVRFFVQSVFPDVRRAAPDARLMIVGRSPTPDVSALHDGRTIFVAGDVPSVEEYYARATIAVAPVRFGGGTRLKILEAWAHGVPVVSTTVGCEGLKAIDGQHLVIADRARDFAARCVELLQSPERRKRMTNEAWHLVSNQYGWDTIGKRLALEIAPLLTLDVDTGQCGACPISPKP
jgi:polysaccharide biosynthesis protein PslH